jgi:hypothetical protein
LGFVLFGYYLNFIYSLWTVLGATGFPHVVQVLANVDAFYRRSATDAVSATSSDAVGMSSTR